MPKDICAPLDIAKWFINRTDRDAGDGITHLKMQKLVYFAQAWHLANFDKPLFQEDMQAWTHGPVVPSLWQQFRNFQWESIPVQKQPKIDDKIAAYLNVIYEKYGKYTARELERITHKQDPWLLTRGDLPLEAKCTDPINKKLIRNYYAGRIGKRWG